MLHDDRAQGEIGQAGQSDFVQQALADAKAAADHVDSFRESIDAFLPDLRKALDVVDRASRSHVGKYIDLCKLLWSARPSYGDVGMWQGELAMAATKEGLKAMSERSIRRMLAIGERLTPATESDARRAADLTELRRVLGIKGEPRSKSMGAEDDEEKDELEGKTDDTGTDRTSESGEAPEVATLRKRAQDAEATLILRDIDLAKLRHELDEAQMIIKRKDLTIELLQKKMGKLSAKRGKRATKDAQDAAVDAIIAQREQTTGIPAAMEPA